MATEGSSFGTRFLKEESDAFTENSWDNVDLTKEEEQEALLQIEKQRNNPVTDPSKYTKNPSDYWNAFYDNHEGKFFKDRNWFSHEFPELKKPNQVILELGCGVGNSYFPLVKENRNATVYACDYSQSAISVLKANPLYVDNDETGKGIAFCHDITKPFPSEIIPELSVDIVTMIFVLSAIHPSLHLVTLQNIHRILKPKTGIILYRDYGQFDLTQLRLKANRFIEDSLYVRGDGTLVNFPSLEDIEALAIKAGFGIISLQSDKRLLVNRGKKLKMHRVWHQAKFQA